VAAVVTHRLERDLRTIWEEGGVQEGEEEEATRLLEEVGEEFREVWRERARRRFRRQLLALRKQRARTRKRARPVVEQEEFQRFSLTFRAQHLVLVVSCLILIFTGLPLKWPNSAWANVYFRLTGGVAVSGAIHRVGAVGLIGVGLFHLFYITCLAEGRKNLRELLPRLKDVRDVLTNVGYFLGRRREGARFGRFSYIEKFDYWAVYWGMVVMITSGLMMWGEEIAMRLFPKFALDMAHEAHSDEALLATLAIIVWHFYNVHLNPHKFPMSWTWWHGKLTKEEMLREHPLEYEEIMRERARQQEADGELESDE
jgi:cytochrome b subunit of formate dehydrogenase